jgi:hypothetical protein
MCLEVSLKGTILGSLFSWVFKAKDYNSVQRKAIFQIRFLMYLQYFKFIQW